MDTISKKIASISTDEEIPRVVTLQTNIKRATSNYIKEHLLSLPALPSVSELEKIRKEHSQRLSNVSNVDLSSKPVKNAKIKRVAIETGWTPGMANSSDSEDDIFLKQIKNVEHFIKEAESAQKYEEVASLKKNLKDLREMYRETQMKKVLNK